MDYSNLKIEKELKIIFMGTPEFSVPILKGLIENYKVRAIVTQPDRLKKKGKLISTPVKQVGIDHTILVLQPEKIEDAVLEIKSFEPDLIITAAYGQILPKEILETPRLGCINVHASLLPKLRGGAPIHRAIINGYNETGITIMHMSNRMDAGDIISHKKLKIKDKWTASMLHDKLSILGRNLLLETLPSIIDGTASREKQDNSAVTYAFNLQRKDEKINFSKTKRQIYNQIRGLNSWPGAYCYFNEKILKVWKSYQTNNHFSNAFNGEITKIYKDGFGVKVSNGEIVFTSVQLEGSKKMKAKDFLNGLPNKESIVGKILD